MNHKTGLSLAKINSNTVTSSVKEQASLFENHYLLVNYKHTKKIEKKMLMNKFLFLILYL